MRDRPFYIGLLCWYLILANTWFLIRSFGVIHSPHMLALMKATPLLPSNVQVTKYFLSTSVPLLCGIFMSQGANWARVLYIGWGLINYAMDAYFVADQMTVLPNVAVFALFSILLLLPAPGGYFLLPRHHS